MSKSYWTNVGRRDTAVSVQFTFSFFTFIDLSTREIILLDVLQRKVNLLSAFIFLHYFHREGPNSPLWSTIGL